MRGTAARSRRNLLGAAVGALALTASACVADDADPDLAVLADGDAVTIVMDDFSFSPPRMLVQAGSTIQLTLVNEGTIEHELMIGQLPQAAGGYGSDLLALMLPVEDETSTSPLALALPDADTDEAAMSDGSGDDGPAEQAEAVEAAAGADHDDAGAPPHSHGEEEAEAVEAAAGADHDDAGTAPHSHGEEEAEAAAGTDPDEAMSDRSGDDGEAAETAAGADQDDAGAAAHSHGEDAAPDHHEDAGGAADHHGGAGGHAGAHLTLGPGESVEILLTVPADASGTWEIGCFIEGHYEAGMKGVFTVR